MFLIHSLSDASPLYCSWKSIFQLPFALGELGKQLVVVLFSHLSIRCPQKAKLDKEFFSSSPARSRIVVGHKKPPGRSEQRQKSPLLIRHRLDGCYFCACLAFCCRLRFSAALTTSSSGQFLATKAAEAPFACPLKSEKKAGPGNGGLNCLT
jgi:hypothetical protein